MHTLEEWSHLWMDDGRMLRTDLFDMAHDIKNIVDTTAEIARSSDPLFYTAAEGKRTVVKARPLGNKFLRLLKADLHGISMNFPKHRFNPHYTIFKRHAKSLSSSHSALNLDSVDVLNGVIENIRRWANGPAATKRMNNLLRCERQNASSTGQLLMDLRSIYSKLQAVRVDLGYYSEYGPGGYHGQEMTLKEAQQHLRAVLKFLRKGPFRYHLAGYIWKLEWAPQKGYHIHFAAFFDGQRVQQDVSIANALGRHWKEVVTGGKGMFFNCNLKKEQYRYCGLGRLDRSDDEKWSALHRAIRYLTKVDLYVRYLAPKGCRTLDSGGPYAPNRRRVGFPKRARQMPIVSAGPSPSPPRPEPSSPSPIGLGLG